MMTSNMTLGKLLILNVITEAVSFEVTKKVKRICIFQVYH